MNVKSTRCQCKELNNSVRDYWVKDKETGRNYFDSENANFGIVYFQEFEKKIKLCWMGKTFKQIEELFPPLSRKVKNQELAFEFYTSKQLLNCKRKGIGCTPSSRSAYNFQIQFNQKLNGVIKRIEVHTQPMHGGGIISFELFDYFIDDLWEMGKQIKKD